MKRKKSAIIEKTDNDIRINIGYLIKQIRKEKNLSAETVAKKIEISRAALTQIENGRNNISAVTIWKLACVLGVEASNFFPKIPEGFGLRKHDLDKLEKEDDNVVTWATQLFGPIESE